MTQREDDDMTKSVTIRELYNFLKSHNLIEQLLGVDDEGEEGTCRGIEAYCFECGNVREYLEWVAGLSCSIKSEKDPGSSVITYDPNRFNVIQAFAQLVWAEYNCPEDNIYRNHPTIWRMFWLRGDDDVDFCSGYLEILVEILESWEGRDK
jgi:hypothetical protein